MQKVDVPITYADISSLENDLRIVYFFIYIFIMHCPTYSLCSKRPSKAKIIHVLF